MPKLKPSDLEIQNRNTRAVIKYCQERTGVTDDTLAKSMCCTVRTIQNKRKHPDTLTLRELRVLSKVLKMTEEQKAELYGMG